MVIETASPIPVPFLIHVYSKVIIVMDVGKQAKSLFEKSRYLKGFSFRADTNGAQYQQRLIGRMICGLDANSAD